MSQINLAVQLIELEVGEELLCQVGGSFALVRGVAKKGGSGDATAAGPTKARLGDDDDDKPEPTPIKRKLSPVPPTSGDHILGVVHLQLDELGGASQFLEGEPFAVKTSTSWGDLGERNQFLYDGGMIIHPLEKA